MGKRWPTHRSTPKKGHSPFDGPPIPAARATAPNWTTPTTLRWLGRFIARLHAVGQVEAFAHRRNLTPDTFGRTAIDRITALDLVPPGQAPAWQDAAERALAAIQAAWSATSACTLRLHGDCHPGNILWRTPDQDAAHTGPHIVDLDDAVNGPAVQDLWMLLSGDRESMRAQLAAVLSGYRQIRRFDTRELALIEPLRTLRMLHPQRLDRRALERPGLSHRLPVVWHGRLLGPADLGAARADRGDGRATTRSGLARLTLLR